MNEKWVPTGEFRTDGRPVLKKIKVKELPKDYVPPEPEVPLETQPAQRASEKLPNDDRPVQGR